jgi:hypothetical protein
MLRSVTLVLHPAKVQAVAKPGLPLDVTTMNMCKNFDVEEAQDKG